MKTIKDVDSRPAHMYDDAPAEIATTLPTYRSMFKSALALGLAKSGENAIDMIEIGFKFRSKESDIALEDAEFKTLKDRCAENTPQWQAYYHGQVMLKLKEAENSK